jgi:hypothetical protein
LDFSKLENGTDIFSRNVGKELPLYTAQQSRRAQISSKGKITLTQTQFKKKNGDRADTTMEVS